MKPSTFLLLCLSAPLALACTGAISCSSLEANGLTFDCRTAGPADGTPVLLLHGFPAWSEMYEPLMTRLAGEGFRSVACNQRGYSPGASPEGEENYLYNTLASDVWAIADAAGFSRFHLVAHDHGAVLGWVVAASRRGRRDILSYTSLSVPHVDAFSSGLCGTNADPAQQIASQYATMFVLEDSASLQGAFWYNVFGGPNNADSGFATNWPAATDFQKALWWYNGMTTDGYLASPPVLPVEAIPVPQVAFLRQLFPDDPAPCVEQPTPVGRVKMPVLYICGSGDTAILCDRPYAHRTADYVNPRHYESLTVDCGHNLHACDDAAVTTAVEDSVIAHLVRYRRRGRGSDSESSSSESSSSSEE